MPILFLSVALAPVAFADGMPGDGVYAPAAALVAQGKHAQAATALEKFLADFPKHLDVVPARLRLGEAQLALGRPDAALKSYEAALAAIGEKGAAELRAEALVGCGRAHAALKADAKALKAWSDAFDLTEFNDTLGPVTGLLLGDLLFRQGSYKEAARAFYRVTRWPTYPEAGRAYFMVGESYRLGGGILDAAFAYQNAAEKYPKDPLASRAALAAGDAFLDQNRLTEAEAAYQRVGRLYPDSAEAPRAQMGMGRVAFQGGQYAVARAAYQAASLLFPASGLGPEAELRIADCYLAEKSLPEARGAYSALLTSPNRLVAGEAGYSLALTYLREGKLTPAADRFRKVGDDRDAGRWSQLARLRLCEIRAGAGDHAFAAATLQALVGEKPEPAIAEEASYRLGEALLKRGEPAAAEKELNGLLARSPFGPFADGAGVLLAQCRLEQKDAAGATTRLVALLKKEIAPEVRAGALAALGRAQLAAKQDAAGVLSLREVLEKHPAATAAPEAARMLLGYYRDRKQDAQVAEIEKIIIQRYAGAGVAVEGLLDAAARQLQAGQYSEALGAYGQVLERRPDRMARLKARAGMAEACAYLKRPSEAETHVEALLQDAPPPALLARTHYRVGNAYYQGGRLEDALAALNWARTEGPDDETAPAILLALGRVYSDTRKLPQAETTLRAILDRYGKSPQMPEALYALAWCFLDREKPDAALPLFHRIVNEYAGHPLAADASFRLGEAEYEAGTYSTAAERYRKTAEAGGALAPRALYKLGWSLRQLGDHAGAARTFVKLLAQDPKSDLALESRLRAGEAYAALEQDFPALEQLQAVLAQGGADETLAMQARLGMAAIYLRDGDNAGARTLVEGIATPANGWIGGRAQLLRAEAAGGREGLKAAAAQYSRAASLWGRYKDIAAEAQFRLGECYERLGNLPDARSAWQRVVDLYRGTGWDRRSREKLTGKPTVLNIGM